MYVVNAASTSCVNHVTAYPISGADLSVAASGTGEGGELGDGDTPLTEANHVVSTLCPSLYETWAHCGVSPRLRREGTIGGDWRRGPCFQQAHDICDINTCYLMVHIW